MVSETLAQAIINQRVPDLIGQFEQGQEVTRQKQTRTLAGQALQEGGGRALDELKALNPEVALSLGEAIRAQSGADINEFIRDAKIGQNLLLQGNTQGFLSFADQRSNILRQQGRDTTQTDNIRDLVAAGQSQEALQQLQAFSGSIDQVKDVTARQKEFEQFLSMPEGKDKEAFGRLIGAISRRESVEEVGAKAKARAGAESVKISIKKAGEAFDKIPSVTRAISNIDEAIAAIDEGASTGVIRSKLPSIKAASIKLDQVRNQMGLDVVGATTFGALSESELAFALDTALPTNLQPKDLRDFLVRKKDAQEKLRAGLEEAAVFLMEGNTVADLVKKRRSDREANNQGAQSAPDQTQGAAQPTELKFLGFE